MEQQQQMLFSDSSDDLINRQLIRNYLRKTLTRYTHQKPQVPLSHALKVVYIWYSELQYWIAKKLEVIEVESEKRLDDYRAMKIMYPEDVPKEVQQLNEGSAMVVDLLEKVYEENSNVINVFGILKQKLKNETVPDGMVEVVEI